MTIAKARSKSTRELAIEHLVIRASAGTGKTFALANRYISLLNADVSADQILAITFARKAAGEILDRILMRLAEAATRDDKCQELGRFVSDPELTTLRCAALLRQMVQNLGRLRIGTLDSYFVQQIRSRGWDLGMPPGWQIAEDHVDQRMRQAAVSELLRNNSHSDLVLMMQMLNRGAAGRSVHASLERDVNNLHNIFADSQRTAWQQIPRHSKLDAADFSAACEALEQLGPLSQKSHNKAWLEDRARVASLQWKDFLTKGLARCVATGSSTYQRAELSPATIAVYTPLVEHAKGIVLGDLANQTEASFDMLSRFDSEYSMAKFRAGQFRFDDITRLLSPPDTAAANVQPTNDPPDPNAAAADTVTTGHLLLDEFQDTSTSQYRILKPLAQRITDGPADTQHSFFCVGDMKQAIYGWRGGVAEVFDDVAATLPVATQSLSKSFRSSPSVIDTVNKIFLGLATAALPTGWDKFDAWQHAVTKWSPRFELHTTARTDLTGYASLHSAPVAELPGSDRQRLTTLLYAAGEAARLHKAYPGASIGILVRNNRSILPVIHELRTRYSISASEEGGNRLTEAMTVEIALAALQLADHPGNRVARYRVFKSPLAQPLGISNIDDEAAMVRVAAAIRQQLLSDGYGTTIHGWLPHLAGIADPIELQRLHKLVELARQWDRSATLRCDDFVNFVRTVKVEEASAARIRVMTIHQSKGLEFDIVILPDLDQSLRAVQVPAAVVRRDGVVGPTTAVIRYASQPIRSQLSLDLQDIFTESAVAEVNEALCLLYVAVTRAARALHMIIAPSPAKESTVRRHFAGLLRARLAPLPTIPPQQLLWETGDANWGSGDHEMLTPALDVPVETITVQLRQPASNQPRSREFVQPSKSAASPETALHALKQQLSRASTASLAKTRGAIVHRWFEQIEWLDEPSGSKSISSDMLRRHVADIAPGIDIDRLEQEFRTMLQQADLPVIFHRREYMESTRRLLTDRKCRLEKDDALRVSLRREWPFVVPVGDALMRGQIDRLVIWHCGSQVVAADIIDFKTDRLPETESDTSSLPAHTLAKYRQQLQAYRAAVRAGFRLSDDAVLSRLVMAQSGAAVLLE